MDIPSKMVLGMMVGNNGRVVVVVHAVDNARVSFHLQKFFINVTINFISLVLYLSNL